jgi:hypothetical protein
MFTTFNPKEEDALPKCRNLFNAIYAQSRVDSTKMCCGTDCSISKRSSHQATASFIIEQAGRETLKSTWVTGRVLSTDAELFTVCMAVCKAVTLEDCHHIIIFTDSMVVAKQAVDPSVHSKQAHSLATCKALAQWLAISENHRVEFITTHPSWNGAFNMQLTVVLAASLPFRWEGGLLHRWTVCRNVSPTLHSISGQLCARIRSTAVTISSP